MAAFVTFYFRPLEYTDTKVTIMLMGKSRLNRSLSTDWLFAEVSACFGMVLICDKVPIGDLKQRKLKRKPFC